MNNWEFDARGLRLRVWELQEQDDGHAPVICLHAWLDNGLSFARVAENRPGRWIAPDQRGFGQSDHLSQGGYYHFADLVADLDALIEHIGGPVNLVGHSMGAGVALYYAGARPDMVRRLVAIEGMGAIEAVDPSPLKRTRMFLEGLRKPPRPARPKTVEAAADRLLKRHPGLTLEHAQILAKCGTTTDEHGLRWSFDTLHMVRGAYPFREATFLEFLAAITAPTLVVWAEDSWYPPEIRTRRVAAIQNATVVTLPGGHMLPYQVPHELGDLIEAHLDWD